MANSAHPGSDSVLVAAAQPMSAGSAPGIAPTIVDSDERSLSGVYQTT